MKFSQFHDSLFIYLYLMGKFLQKKRDKHQKTIDLLLNSIENNAPKIDIEKISSFAKKKEEQKRLMELFCFAFFGLEIMNKDLCFFVIKHVIEIVEQVKQQKNNYLLLLKGSFLRT